MQEHRIYYYRFKPSMMPHFRIEVSFKGDLIICSERIPIHGYYCPTCGIDQPFQNYNCIFCDGFSDMGDPHDPDRTPEQEIEFDKFFETDKVAVLTEVKVTKTGNIIYKRNGKTS